MDYTCNMKKSEESLGAFCDEWKKETEELEKSTQEMVEKIKREAKEKNKILEERWDAINKYKVKVTKCYLVQIFDENLTEIKSEYSFEPTKKDAEAVGYKIVEQLVDEELNSPEIK